jgi:hypothetical protein
MEKKKFLEPEPEKTSVVAEPHFEEAWTVLAARPVVPLKPVEARPRLLGTLKLVGAFIAASLLGVVVGLASIRFRQLTSPVTETALPVQSDATHDAQDETSTTEQTAIAPTVEAAPVKTPSRITETSKRHDNQNAATDKNASQADTDSSGSAQLADQWQESRPRRVKMRRQRRELDDLRRRDRDLLRIQEIFEGRRPRN